ncbi:MAG TPA: serine/threonine-protein kinase, partial [Gemmataceae bacterium]|nr:serine/threonine-protein kinase [Gemmataceae bacterium]
MTDTEPTDSALKSLVVWIDAAADRFDAAWRDRPHPPLADFLSGTGGDRQQLLKELVKVDLEYRRRRGEPFRAEQYLADWPELRCPDGGLPEDLVQYGRDLDARFPPAEAGGAFTLPRTLGRFHFLELLGSGSFGSVYKARDADLGRLVAVKVPHPALVLLPAQRGRLAREAQSAAKLHHPNIVTVYEVADLDGVPCLVSEWVDGKTLAAVGESGRPDPAWSAGQVAAVADALQYAHSLGVVHRDVTPRNILLDGDRPRLTDFGLARQDGDAFTLTVPGEVLGTPAYMSPEQARGDAHGVGPRSDVYSLGAVLYDLLTGGPPFTGPAHTVLARVQTEEPPRPRRANPAVARDLETVCLKCLEKTPESRYATAADLAADLRRCVAGEPVTARPLGPVARLARWCRRKPWTAALLGLVFFALVAVAVAGFWVAENSRARELDRRREVLAQKLQRIRLAPRQHGWSAEAWQLVEEAAKLRPSADLRDEAASILAGTDAQILWHNRLSGAGSVAVSADGRRFLVGTATETILLEGDAVAARVPGGGPVAFLPDGTPVHLKAEAKSFSLVAVPDDRTVRT